MTLQWFPAFRLLSSDGRQFKRSRAAVLINVLPQQEHQHGTKPCSVQKVVPQLITTA